MSKILFYFKMTSQHKDLTNQHNYVTSRHIYVTSGGRNMPPYKLSELWRQTLRYVASYCIPKLLSETKLDMSGIINVNYAGRF